MSNDLQGMMREDICRERDYMLEERDILRRQLDSEPSVAVVQGADELHMRIAHTFGIRCQNALSGLKNSEEALKSSQTHCFLKMGDVHERGHLHHHKSDSLPFTHIMSSQHPALTSKIMLCDEDGDDSKALHCSACPS